MDREVKIEDFLSGSKEVKSTVNIIGLDEFKNFSQIQKGLSINAPKAKLMQNPIGYQNFFNEVERVAKMDGIGVALTEAPDSYILTFK